MPFYFNPFTNNPDYYATGGSGSGDVSGPASSTDNAVVRFSGTTGKIIQNSSVIISDTGDITANSITLTVPISETNGGTGQVTYSTGDLLYASAPDTLSVLPIGSATQVLTVTGGIPVWAASASGGVTSVSGTAGRITSSGGATPVIDIDATYVGQTSITTLGTIATGTWSASTIAVNKGGTGATTLTNHGVVIGQGTSAVAITAAGTAGQVLQSGGAAADPTYSTATYPSTATGTGTILRANGTNWVATNATYPNTVASGDFLYGSASNVISTATIPANTSATGTPILTIAGIPTWAVETNYSYWADDFLGGVLRWQVTTSGTGSSVGQNNSNTGINTSNPGFAIINCGTTTTGRAGIEWASNSGTFILSGGGQIIINMIVRFVNLSDVTDTFTAYLGFGDSQSAEPSNGIYFLYNDTTNSGNWVAKTANGGTRSTANSAIAASTSFQKLTIIINSGATSVSFYVNDTEIANSPLTTNIPTTNACTPRLYFIKSAGTNNRQMIVDYFSYFKTLSTPRV